MKNLEFFGNCLRKQTFLNKESGCFRFAFAFGPENKRTSQNKNYCIFLCLRYCVAFHVDFVVVFAFDSKIVRWNLNLNNSNNQHTKQTNCKLSLNPRPSQIVSLFVNRLVGLFFYQRFLHFFQTVHNFKRNLKALTRNHFSLFFQRISTYFLDKNLK